MTSYCDAWRRGLLSTNSCLGETRVLYPRRVRSFVLFDVLRAPRRFSKHRSLSRLTLWPVPSALPRLRNWADRPVRFALQPVTTRGPGRPLRPRRAFLPPQPRPFLAFSQVVARFHLRSGFRGARPSDCGGCREAQIFCEGCLLREGPVSHCLGFFGVPFWGCRFPGVSVPTKGGVPESPLPENMKPGRGWRLARCLSSLF